MTRWTVRQRVRYLFESTLAAGTWPVILWMAALTLLLIAVAAILLTVTGIATPAGPNAGALEEAWLTLMRTLDPGTMAGDSGWAFRVISLGATLTGILIVSSLIGPIASAIDRKVVELRKGRTPVVVERHTLVLGWSPKVTTLVSELVIANENQRNAHIVILAPEDKVMMEDEIRTRVRDTRGTTVVCRTGQPSDLQALGLVNAQGARSIIVVSPVGESADAEVVRAALALQTLELDPSTPVIAEILDLRRAEALRAVTHERVTIVVSTEVISRIAAQVCRYRGLSHVFQELLDFAGDEIYFQVELRLEGLAFGVAALSYETSSVIGVRHADGRVAICPPMDTIIERGDAVIAISLDDDTVVLDPELQRAATTDETAIVRSPPPEHLLVLGWNRLGAQILHALDPYVQSGSTAHVVFDPEWTTSRHAPCLEQLDHLSVTVEEGDTNDPDVLDRLIRDRRYHHIIVLCHRRRMTTMESDAQALMTLLLVRAALERYTSHDERPSIVTELLDVHDVEIAPAAGSEDFIVSERLTSLMLSQLSENVELDRVFRSFFRSDGAEIATRPATNYVSAGSPVQVSALASAVAARGELLIGYRSVDHLGGHSVVVNPAKSTLVSAADDDELVVVTRRGSRPSMGGGLRAASNEAPRGRPNAGRGHRSSTR